MTADLLKERTEISRFPNARILLRSRRQGRRRDLHAFGRLMIDEAVMFAKHNRRRYNI